MYHTLSKLDHLATVIDQLAASNYGSTTYEYEIRSSSRCLGLIHSIQRPKIDTKYS